MFGGIVIIVKCRNDYFINEREYIYDVILSEFFGINYELQYEDRDDICIQYDSKEIFLSDSFFHVCTEDYLTVESMPKNIDIWECDHPAIVPNLIDVHIPVIYGNRLTQGGYIEVHSNQIEIGIDIFGSAFFMLTRYEEMVNKKRDSLGRFSAKDSVAYQNRFIERPIINEYIEILWWAIHKLWPALKRKDREYNLLLTHDVDRPSLVLNFMRKEKHLRRFIGDLIVRRSLRLALRRCNVMWAVLRHGFKAEWKYTFDYIMDKSDQMGVKSTFFFMTPSKENDFDGDYYIDDENIIDIIKHIINRGHNIGLHPEFDSYNNMDVIEKNVSLLRESLSNNDVKIGDFGARQHYLRWENGTWDKYDRCGIKYDTTLSFADHIGFRCGICYDYPVYSLEKRKKMKMREYPLIVMDGSAVGYMGLSFDEAAARIIKLKNICKKYSGNFVLLWHNDAFLDVRMNSLYDKILEG